MEFSACTGTTWRLSLPLKFLCVVLLCRSRNSCNVVHGVRVRLLEVPLVIGGSQIKRKGSLLHLCILYAVFFVLYSLFCMLYSVFRLLYSVSLFPHFFLQFNVFSSLPLTVSTNSVKHSVAVPGSLNSLRDLIVEHFVFDKPNIA